MIALYNIYYVKNVLSNDNILMLYINIFTFWQQNKTNKSLLRNFPNQYSRASDHLSEIKKFAVKSFEHHQSKGAIQSKRQWQ